MPRACCDFHSRAAACSARPARAVRTEHPTRTITLSTSATADAATTKAIGKLQPPWDRGKTPAANTGGGDGNKTPAPDMWCAVAELGCEPLG